MQALSTHSVTSHVNDWLAKSRRPRILHIFDSVCNLINEHRQVLSIVTPEIGNGPFSLVVENRVFFSDHLSLQSPISISQSKLTTGDLIIQTANAKLWKPTPDWKRLHALRERIAGQLLQLPLPTDSRLLPQPLVSSLSLALVHKDLLSTQKVTSKLAGLGAGLTPAGDDFIMGAIHAVWIIHPPEVASALTQAIANTAAPLTTSLSGAWLRFAAKGDAGILWHQFFEALVGRVANPTYLHETMDNILSVGETSGADALAGFSNTLTAWATSSSRK